MLHYYSGAVGSEIYGPIFRAGLFLVLSGFLSAAIAGFIVNKNNTWDELGLEFEKGKEAQLIPETLEVSSATQIVEEGNKESSKVSDEMKYLDL